MPPTKIKVSTTLKFDEAMDSEYLEECVNATGVVKVELKSVRRVNKVVVVEVLSNVSGYEKVIRTK